MPQILNLVGRRFGRLIVNSLASPYISPNGIRKIKWRCICDCGKIVEINSRELLAEKTKSCGCIRFKEKNIIGLKFGKLLVIEMGTPYIDKRGRSQSRWACLCECGNTTIATSSALRRGKHISCGCVKDSKIATQLKEYLIDNYQGISEYKVLRIPDTNFYAPYDIYLPEGIFIEVHGRHHYESNHWFHHLGKTSYKRRKYIDRMKRQYAIENGLYIEIDLRKIKTVEQAIYYIEQRM